MLNPFKIDSEATLPNSFYEAKITLTLNPDKDKKIKLYLNILIKICAQISNEILANQIQQCIKVIIYCDQVGFIPGIKVEHSWLKF